MTALSFLAVLGAAQGAILGLALLTIRRGNRKANRALGVFVIMFSATLSTAALVDLDMHRRLPHLMFVTHPMMLAFGPLLLLYVLYLISKTGTVRRAVWFNFLPALAYVGYLAPFYAQSADTKLALLDEPETISTIDYILTTFQIAHLVGYLIAVYLVVRRFRLQAQHTFSSTEVICLDWLSSSIRWFFLLCVLLLVSTSLHAVGLETVSDVSGNLVLITIVIIIYGIGYRGLRQPEILGLAEVQEVAQKYEKSTLTDSAADRHLERLMELMDSAKPFLRGDLTIRDLAELSGIPGYHLSQLLNEKLNQNFFDFINRYRVEEAKRALLDPARDHLTILAVALEAGFSSKSAFNAAFKKQTGTTPSEFRKRRSAN